MSEDEKPRSGGRRRADVAPDSPSTAEIPLVSRHAADHPGQAPSDQDLPEQTQQPEPTASPTPEPAAPEAPTVRRGAPAVRHPSPSASWQTPSDQAGQDATLRRGRPGKLSPPAEPLAGSGPRALQSEPRPERQSERAPDPAPVSSAAQAPEPVVESSARSRDRRSLGRTNPVVLLGVLLPLLTVAALVLVQPSTTVDRTAAPTSSPLLQATVLCPTAEGATTWVGVADPASGGQVTGSGTATIQAGVVTRAEGPVLLGTEATAVGMVAAVVGRGTALTCSQPRFDQWFAGVGASAEHRSTLTLTNPDAGTAVADITVYGTTGEVADAADMRGVSVAGKQTVSIELDQRVPVADDLALHVAVSRGRLGVQVSDTHQPIGTRTEATDWATPQLAPAEDIRLIGLGKGRGTRTLTVLNPSDSEARVSLQLVADASEFTPTGLDDLTLAPGQVRTVDLSKLLKDPTADGTRGVRVTGTRAVVAGLTSVVGQELVTAVPTTPLTTTAGLPLPDGAKQLVLAGAAAAGEVTVTTRSSDGTVLAEKKVAMASSRSATITLADQARWVTVDPAGTGVGGAVNLGSQRGAVLALWPLVTEDLVPQVRQALS